MKKRENTKQDEFCCCIVSLYHLNFETLMLWHESNLGKLVSWFLVIQGHLILSDAKKSSVTNAKVRINITQVLQIYMIYTEIYAELLHCKMLFRNLGAPLL